MQLQHRAEEPKNRCTRLAQLDQRAVTTLQRTISQNERGPLESPASLFHFKSNGGPSPANKNETASEFYITDFISFPVTPWYRDPDYLRRKYLTEQLSTRQIAEEIGSARATVARYLKGFKIPLRRHEDTVRLRKSSLAYGERLQDGKIVPCKRELQVIAMVKNLRAQGMSLQAIADFLNSTKIPTKSKKSIWKHQTVGNLLD